jgi:hypothetical protein
MASLLLLKPATDHRQSISEKKSVRPSAIDNLYFFSYECIVGFDAIQKKHYLKTTGNERL